MFSILAIFKSRPERELLKPVCFKRKFNLQNVAHKINAKWLRFRRPIRMLRNTFRRYCDTLQACCASICGVCCYIGVKWHWQKCCASLLGLCDTNIGVILLRFSFLGEFRQSFFHKDVNNHLLHGWCKKSIFIFHPRYFRWICARSRAGASSSKVHLSRWWCFIFKTITLSRRKIHDRIEELIHPHPRSHIFNCPTLSSGPWCGLFCDLEVRACMNVCNRIRYMFKLRCEWKVEENNAFIPYPPIHTYRNL